MFKTLSIAAFAALIGMSVQADESDPNVKCLAQAIYFEARGETREQQLNVAWVIYNRARSKYYPNTLCGVIHQANKNADGSLKRYECAFSYYCDGVSDKPKNIPKWNDAMAMAQDMQAVLGIFLDPTKGADHYHTPAVSPNWEDATKVTLRDGAHIFYDIYTK